MESSDYQSFSALHAALEACGAAELSRDSSFLTASDWSRLASLILDLPYERVIEGDAGEPNEVLVGRIMTDIEKPEIANSSAAVAILEVLLGAGPVEFYNRLLGSDISTIRRAQVNRIGPEGFVGKHLDTDSNRDYEYSIALQFGERFEAGEFVVHQTPGLAPLVFKPVKKSIIVSNCAFEHEVRPVISGTRVSLVYFISRHDGPNSTPPRPSVLADIEGRTS